MAEAIEPSSKFSGDFTINTAKNTTSNYGDVLGTLNLYSADAQDYTMTIDGQWAGTYTGSTVEGSGSYSLSGSASGSTTVVVSSSGDYYSGSYSGSIAHTHGTGSYCISGSGDILLLKGTGVFTGSYVSGAADHNFQVTGADGYYLTGTIYSYYLSGTGEFYVSGSSLSSLSASAASLAGQPESASYYISGASTYDTKGASEYYVSGTHTAASLVGTGSVSISGHGTYDISGYEPKKDPRQVPFSLGVKGVPFLRGRTTAYKVER